MTATCGYSGTVIQIASIEVVDQIDQGIRDVYYTTELQVGTHIYGYPKHLPFEYKVSVKSVYSDSYNHPSAEWGVYHVSEVSCNK